MAIQINTGAVRTVAEEIEAANKRMQDDLSDVDRALRAMEQSWQGDGSNACSQKYRYIKENLPNARYNVINNLVVFMKQQVGDSYEVAEQKISNAAAAFK